jgi:hypothetical protein
MSLLLPSDVRHVAFAIRRREQHEPLSGAGRTSAATSPRRAATALPDDHPNTRWARGVLAQLVTTRGEVLLNLRDDETGPDTAAM